MAESVDQTTESPAPSATSASSIQMLGCRVQPMRHPEGCRQPAYWPNPTRTCALGAEGLFRGSSSAFSTAAEDGSISPARREASAADIHRSGFPSRQPPPGKPGSAFQSPVCRLTDERTCSPPVLPAQFRVRSRRPTSLTEQTPARYARDSGSRMRSRGGAARNVSSS
jgi:hypothetical protein